jgi:hypothetical protein
MSSPFNADCRTYLSAQDFLYFMRNSTKMMLTIGKQILILMFIFRKFHLNFFSIKKKEYFFVCCVRCNFILIKFHLTHKTNTYPLYKCQYAI